MGMNVSGAGAPPPQGPVSGANNAKQIIQAVKEGIADMQNLSEEAAFSGGTATHDAAKSKSASGTQQQSTAVKPEDVQAALAVFTSETDEVKKKKKKEKKKKLDEKLTMLEEMGEMVDTQALTEEEKAILEEFQKNMGKMKQLKGKIRFLDDKEERLMKLLEEKAENEASNNG
ncbi:MAG: hypothetical protein CL521_03340 [Actinobacteria bacterium]|nr:hypothetical protein [Actinomycetota bacterium]